MSDSPDEDVLYDAFNRFLEARFHGADLDPSTVTGPHQDPPELVHRAARLADWVVSPPHDVLPPLVESYRIRREVGHGSMGTVFLAHDEKLDRDVALKVLRHGAALSARHRQRFVREARAMANLEDDHIVRVYDVIAEGDVLAYAMEWVDGGSLRDVLERLRVARVNSGSAPTAALAAALGTDARAIRGRSAGQLWLHAGITIARALHRVHDAGFVHRDVKPGNILLRRNGEPLLADFGLALAVDSSMTRTVGFAGTPCYAPPEQLGADQFVAGQTSDGAPIVNPVDHRADIYSLGATLYECFAGAPPFTGSNPAKLLHQIETIGARPLRKVAPGAPRDLEVVLEKAMSPDRSNRYASAGELADDLERVLELRPVHARRPGLATRGMRALRYRHPALVGASIVAATVLAAAGVWLELDTLKARATEESESQLHAARGLLLEPRVRNATWRAAQLGRVEASEFEAAQALRREAVQHYAAALGHRPDATADSERDALRMVIDLPRIAPHGLDHAELARDYPALALGTEGTLVVVVERIAQAPRSPVVSRLVVAKQVTEELQWKLGLIAYLAGDDSVCEDLWLPLSKSDIQWPLLDVALARMFSDDTQFGLALPRLQRAVRQFPEREDLALDLTHAYLELGDSGSALRVLRGVEPEVAKSFRYRLLLNWAQSHLPGAVEGLRALVVERPSSEEARYRLALLEHRDGHAARALGIVRALVDLSPESTRYRLTLARLAVSAGDTADYLDQARYVLQRGFGLGGSAGTTRDLLDILQVGGLTGLYAQGVQRTRRRGSAAVTAMPASVWARSAYGSVQAVESALLTGRAPDGK